MQWHGRTYDYGQFKPFPMGSNLAFGTGQASAGCGEELLQTLLDNVQHSACLTSKALARFELGAAS